MGDAAGYAYLSLQQAIAQAGLSEDQVSNPRTGIVAGSGGASSASQVEAADGGVLAQMVREEEAPLRGLLAGRCASAA